MFEHSVKTAVNAWIYAGAGDIEYRVHGEWFSLKQGESGTISKADGEAVAVRGSSSSRSHFAMLSGEAINETFVQQGPIVMSTQRDIDDVVARYEDGKLGQLA